MSESKVWFWKDPDSRWKKNVIEYIKTISSSDTDIIILHCIEIEGFNESIPLTKYMLNLCEQLGIFKNERTMFLNPKDFFQAIELCLGRMLNKESKNMKIKDEDIIQCHHTYIDHFKCKNDNAIGEAVLSLKKFIEENNCADLWLINHLLFDQKTNNNFINHLSHLKFLILGTPPSNIFQNIIGLLSTEETVSDIVVETPLNISLQGSPSSSQSSKVEVIRELIDLKDIPINAESGIKLGSATEEYVQETIISFLSLLVNNRNELALSKAMISPIIDLSHEAFTKLKHLSEEKEMPMCQTAISYVTRINLGGKGYAPPSDCPLLPYLKKLELFVDLLNQMQTLIEEDLTPISAVKRLVNVLKKKLLKCGSDKLKSTAIETASDNLKEIAAKTLNIHSETQSTCVTPQVCDETLDFLHKFINYMNCSYWVFDPKEILSMKLLKRTPINLPPLLGYFRSPEEDSSCDVRSTLDEDSKLSNISTTLPYISYFHHSESSSFGGRCIDSQTPTKLSFKNVLQDSGDNKRTDVSKTNKNSLNSKKGCKRSILREITNENPPEKIKKGDEKKKSKRPLKEANVERKNKSLSKNEIKTKTKNSKKFKLIEGQGKITSFFIKKD